MGSRAQTAFSGVHVREAQRPIKKGRRELQNQPGPIDSKVNAWQSAWRSRMIIRPLLRLSERKTTFFFARLCRPLASVNTYGCIVLMLWLSLWLGCQLSTVSHSATNEMAGDSPPVKNHPNRQSYSMRLHAPSTALAVSWRPSLSSCLSVTPYSPLCLPLSLKVSSQLSRWELGITAVPLLWLLF